MIQFGRYQHYKGNFYTVLGTVTHSETEEILVLYKPETSDRLWVRPLVMFLEKVQVDGKDVHRFQFIN
jgi:hypothetical protein